MSLTVTDYIGHRKPSCLSKKLISKHAHFIYCIIYTNQTELNAGLCQ